MVISPSGAAPALTRGRGKGGGKVGRPKTKHARRAGGRHSKAKPFRTGRNHHHHDDVGGCGRQCVRKWVQIPRPPGPLAKFTVPTWVPIDALTPEERTLYIVAPEPTDAGTSTGNLLAPEATVGVNDPSALGAPSPTSSTPARNVEGTHSNPVLIDIVNANECGDLSNVSTGPETTIQISNQHSLDNPRQQHEVDPSQQALPLTESSIG
jgi:hypothetical protein